MSNHAARFPGKTNNPQTHELSKREAVRLSKLSGVAADELHGKPFAELSERLSHVIDPQQLAFRRICGQVVKTDAEGNERPVPFATVTVYDVDLHLLGWSPSHLPCTWFWPFHWHREEFATVTTDECGRFCVWVPRFDIDYYLRWRLERRCYFEWLRKPTLEDVLEYRDLVPPRPQPIPRPLEGMPILRRWLVDDRLLSRAGRVLDGSALDRLRETKERGRVGERAIDAEAALDGLAYVEPVQPPLTASAKKLLDPQARRQLAARVGVRPMMLEQLDLGRVFGPFLRCKLVAIPEWSAVIDIPDLTFEVRQDIDGDGNQEIIYREGLFDVRWNTHITDVKLHAFQNAIAGPSCDLPDPGECGDPAILFASNYPLQVPSNPSDYHDGASGYAKLPNRPDADGVPGGARIGPAATPFTGHFHLIGCAESPSATHYRIHHEVDGSSGFLRGSFGPLTKVVGGVLQWRTVSPVDGHWYPIVPRSDGWTPVGILAPVKVSGTARHTFRLELGKLTGGSVSPVPSSLQDPVSVFIDTSQPVVADLELAWRHPDSSTTWTELDPYDCAVIERTNPGRVQIRLSLSVTANHLRHFRVAAGGCGPGIEPGLITDGRDGLPVPAPDAAAHWHTSPSDNSATRTLYYEIPARAPAGCYSFSILATSRAFKPTAAITGPDPVVAWQNHDPSPNEVEPVVNVALQ